MDKKQEKRLEYLIDRIMELDEIVKSYKELYSRQLNINSDLCSERDRYKLMYEEVLDDINRLTDSLGEGMTEVSDGRISAE